MVMNCCKVKRVISMVLSLLLILLWGCRNISGKGEGLSNPAVFETGFETDTSGFTARGGSEQLSQTNGAAHSGTYSLKVENRSRNWHGPSLRVERYISEGRTYKISLWIKLISPASAQLQVSTQIGEGNAASYHIILGKVITENMWVQYEGTFRYASSNSYISIYYRKLK
jgi:hypothetical protein